MKNSISVEELYSNYDEYVVLDCRGIIEMPGLSEKLYEEGHLPNAQLFKAEWLISEPTKFSGEDPLPKWDVFAEKLQELGVGNDSKVVIYASNAKVDYAPRLFWSLRYIGMESVKMLRGGMKAWCDAKYPVTDKTVKPNKAKKLTLNFNYDMNYDIADIKNILKTKSHTLVDVRQYGAFLGTKEFGGVGHIPGAVSLDNKLLVDDDGVWNIDFIEKKVAELKAIGKPIVTYCGGGITAAYVGTFLDEYDLGLNMYVGSMSQWTSYPEYEIEKGE